MDKKCRIMTDKLLIEEVKIKRNIMRDTLEALQVEIEKFKAKRKEKQVA